MSQLGPREVIVLLNSLPLSELGAVESELDRAARALDALGQDVLRDQVRDARECLRAGRVKDFRRTVSTITARLGHVK